MFVGLWNWLVDEFGLLVLKGIVVFFVNLFVGFVIDLGSVW